MKKTLLSIIVIFAFLLLILPGCQADKAPSNKEIPANQETQVNITDEDKQDEQEVETTQMTESDTAAYDGAIELGDPSYCEKISVTSMIEQCKTEVNDESILQEALNEQDEAKCEGLSNKDSAAACKTKVEVTIDKQNEREERQSQVTEDEELLNKILEEKSFEMCEQIQNKELKDYCDVGKIVQNAVDKNDTTICDQLENSEDSLNCKKALEKEA